MGTITEEIFSKKLMRKIKAGDIVWTEPDCIMSHDTTTLIAIEAMKQLSTAPRYPDKMVICFDHIVPPANIEQAKVQKKILGYIEEFGIKNFYREGVCHQVIIEKGFILPGSINIGADSHTCSYGAMGAFGTGMGSTDIGIALATGRCWFKVPETILINLTGRFPKGVYAKDLILKIISIIGLDGANYQVLEFQGPAANSFSISERITLCNMAVECGAKTGIFEPDDKTFEFLKNKTSMKIEPVKAHGAHYAKQINIDISQLEPLVAYPHDVDQVKPINETEGVELDEVFIGTCTNGRYDDLELAARIMNGKRVNSKTRTIIIPASNLIYKKAMKDGLIDIFLDAGCIVCNPGCGPCLGRHQGILAPGERALTTMNRNFKGRMGSDQAEIYIASPATCAASAIAGRIIDPRSSV